MITTEKRFDLTLLKFHDVLFVIVFKFKIKRLKQMHAIHLLYKFTIDPHNEAETTCTLRFSPVYSTSPYFEFI